MVAPSPNQRQVSVLEVVDVKQTHCFEYLSIGWNVSFLKVFLETCMLVLDSGLGERQRWLLKQAMYGERSYLQRGSASTWLFPRDRTLGHSLCVRESGESPVCAVWRGDPEGKGVD